MIAVRMAPEQDFGVGELEPKLLVTVHVAKLF
jgi:hypothetical protein